MATSRTQKRRPAQRLDEPLPVPAVGVETLSTMLLDPEFRRGYQLGYRCGVGDLLSRCRFLLARTMALSDLTHHTDRLMVRLHDEVSNATLPYEEA